MRLLARKSVSSIESFWWDVSCSASITTYINLIKRTNLSFGQPLRNLKLISFALSCLLFCLLCLLERVAETTRDIRNGSTCSTTIDYISTGITHTAFCFFFRIERNYRNLFYTVWLVKRGFRARKEGGRNMKQSWNRIKEPPDQCKIFAAAANVSHLAMNKQVDFASVVAAAAPSRREYFVAATAANISRWFLELTLGFWRVCPLP